MIRNKKGGVPKMENFTQELFRCVVCKKLHLKEKQGQKPGRCVWCEGDGYL